MRYRFSDEKKAAATTTSQAESPARLSNSPSCRRAASTTLRPSYGMGMWRAVALLACLTATHAALFTEGGAVQNGQEKKSSNVRYQESGMTKEEEKEVMKWLVEASERENRYEESPGEKDMREVLEQIEKASAYEENFRPVFRSKSRIQTRDSSYRTKEEREEAYREFEKMLEAHSLAENEKPKPYSPPEQSDVFPREPIDPLAVIDRNNRVKETKKTKKEVQEPFDLDDLLKGELMLENEIAKESEEIKNTQEKLAKNTDAAKVNVESLESAMQTATGEPQVPQKKGQNEFVSFVEPEPQPAKQTISSQQIDKRRLATSAEYSGNAPRYSSSSLLLLAVGTVMCVGLVGTVAGGTYYYKNNRRTETPDDGEYAPYAGTGPGFRKNKGNKGDETLAYKAQLHQYQQAKQKIICGEDAPGIIESDGEDGADEENNYSVYECPGLAPTGDIEVCNPNFAAQP